MAKPFKIFLWIVGGFVALIALTAIAVPLLFDPNEHKDEAAKAVHDATGRELRINGDIELTLFPWLGASVADVTLGNVEGFGPEPFLQVAKMDVGVRLMPLLLDRRVEVSKISVDGLALNLVKAADGSNNWGFETQEKEPAAPEQAPTTDGPPLAFSVGGVDIRNATFSYTDKQSGSAYKVANLDVQTGAIVLNQPLDVTIAFMANSTQPALESQVKIAFTALSNLDTKVHEIQDLKIDTDSKGPAVPGGSQKATFRGSARYDQGQGTFALSDAVLEAAGLVMNLAIQGEALTTESPKLSGKLSTNTFNPKNIAKSFGVTLPPTSDLKALTEASFAANYSGDFNSAKLDGLTLKLDQTTATGVVTVSDFKTQAIQFALKADSFNADRYTAPPAPEAEGDASKEDARDFKDTVLPVDALDAVNAKGTVELGALTLKGMKLSNIRIALDAPKGQVKTEEMTAQLYGGRINQTARITPGAKPKYDLKLGLNGIQSAPLQQDFLGKNYLSGLANFTLNVNSGGDTVGDLLRALSGAVATSFKDGAVEGFNLEQTLASAKALYAGQGVPQATGPKRTEFRDLKGSGKIVNGVLDTDTLDVKGSWYQLGGDGKVDLVQQTVNYILYPTVSGERFKELSGTRIPVAVTGSWFDPSIKVDLKGVLKGRVKQELKEEEDELKEKAREKFGDFLRKNLGGQQQPAPSQPAPAPAEPATSAPAEQPPAETPPSQ